jgi:hypothetical protein
MAILAILSGLLAGTFFTSRVFCFSISLAVTAFVLIQRPRSTDDMWKF